MTTDVDRRVAALQERIDAVLSSVRDIVHELALEQDVRFLVAQRLPDLGSAALPPLVELIRGVDQPHEVRVLAAFDALLLGERELSVSVLLAEITADSEYAALAATNLAAVGIVDAAAPIIDAVRRTIDPHKAATFLDALYALGAELPDDVWHKLTSHPSPQLQLALRPWVEARGTTT